MSVTFEIVDDPAHSCSALMVGVASGGGSIVLTGGSTPRRAYEQFAEAVRSVSIDISQATFWIGDERCVAPDDDDSNLKMIRESLLDRLPGTPVIHPMHGELGPLQGAAEYERQLAEAGQPGFDLMLLGIGPDGHTLSLFPGQATLQETEHTVVAVPEAGHEPYVPRISMTLTMVARARRVVMLASGDSKADAIREAFGPDATPDPSVPASMLAAHAEDLIVLIDPAAAAKLPNGGAAS